MFAQISSKLLVPRAPGAPAKRWVLWLAAMRAWLFLLLLLVLFEVWARVSYGATFVFSAYNAQSIAVFAVAPLLLALGETFVIIAGGIDLSVGFIMGLSAVIAAVATNAAGSVLPPVAAMLAGVLGGLAVSLVPGLINGALISKLKVPPFIGTLGMYGVARGVAFLLANGTTVPVSNPWMAALGNGRVAGVPVVVIVTAVFVLVMHYLLGQTRFGQHTYAVGASEQAAVRSGIGVGRHTRKLYLLSALCAGIGGVLYTARLHRRSRAGGRTAAARLDRRGSDRWREPLRRFRHHSRHGRGLAGHRGDPVRARLHRRGALLAVRRRGHRHHHLGAGRPDAAQARRRSLMSLAPSSAPILDVRQVFKRFGGVEALKGVSLQLHPGEVVALAGDNGAGKSTLTKMISGVYAADGGEIRLDGQPIRFATPEAARGAGIETIYQDLALADNLSIGANIFLGREPMRRAFGFLPMLDRRAMAKAAKETMATLDFHVDRLDAPVGRFSGGAAPGRGHRPGDLLERPRHPDGRADCGARRAGTAQGAVPHPPPEGTGARRHLHLAQPAGYLRGVGPHRHPASRQPRG